ncbi:hypothetical protein [Kocuria arenosa]|uniref:hypothetical protein n=1 Tax=Kocuria arenosa TaxID=3071446 RepID=UPI0034D76CAA
MSSDADRVLQLGRDLADALDPSDVVGRWMSHHLAELITRCEASPEDVELAAVTRDTIMQLWAHKGGVHFKTEPLVYVEPVLRAIARLDPDPEPWAFYRPFGERAPGAEVLSTYPLLRLACDIDREVGHLIRLGVAVTARQAISREEPWVLEGMQMAETEEDSAVRTLQQLVQRLSMQSGLDPCEALEIDNQGSTEPDGAHSAAPVDDEVCPSEPNTAVADSNDAAYTVESADTLTTGLRNSVVLCRRLIEQFALLCEEQTAGESEKHTGRTEPGDRPEFR